MPVHFQHSQRSSKGGPKKKNLSLINIKPPLSSAQNKRLVKNATPLMQTENLSMLGKSTLPPSTAQHSFMLSGFASEPKQGKGRAETACKKRKNGFSLSNVAGSAIKNSRFTAYHAGHSHGRPSSEADQRAINRSVDNYRNGSPHRYCEEGLLGTREGCISDSPIQDSKKWSSLMQVAGIAQAPLDNSTLLESNELLIFSDSKQRGTRTCSSSHAQPPPRGKALGSDALLRKGSSSTLLREYEQNVEPLERRLDQVLADERKPSKAQLEAVRAVFAEVIRRDHLFAGVLAKIRGVYEQRVRALTLEEQENRQSRAGSSGVGQLTEEVD